MFPVFLRVYFKTVKFQGYFFPAGQFNDHPVDPAVDEDFQWENEDNGRDLPVEMDHPGENDIRDISGKYKDEGGIEDRQ